MKNLYNNEVRNILSKRTLEANGIELISKDEVFAKIPKWNRYFISNSGRLIHKNSKGRYTVVNPSVVRGGYLSYTLSKAARTYAGQKVKNKNGKPKTQRSCTLAHRLVALLFVSPDYPNSYTIDELQVHHINQNRTDNYYKNLIWLSVEDHHSIHTIRRIELMHKTRGSQFRPYHINTVVQKLNTSAHILIERIKNAPHVEGLDVDDCLTTVFEINDYLVRVSYRNTEI